MTVDQFCFKCGGLLYGEWLLCNVAPHAASSGVMKHFHAACAPIHASTIAVRDVQRSELLRRALVALDDWTNTYASEFCDVKRVHEAHERIRLGGGTLAYIADLVQDIRKELAK